MHPVTHLVGQHECVLQGVTVVELVERREKVPGEGEVARLLALVLVDIGAALGEHGHHLALVVRAQRRHRVHQWLSDVLVVEGGRASDQGHPPVVVVVALQAERFAANAMVAPKRQDALVSGLDERLVHRDRDRVLVQHRFEGGIVAPCPGQRPVALQNGAVQR
jgi:hypothetical protein